MSNVGVLCLWGRGSSPPCTRIRRLEEQNEEQKTIVDRITGRAMLDPTSADNLRIILFTLGATESKIRSMRKDNSEVQNEINTRESFVMRLERNRRAIEQAGRDLNFSKPLPEILRPPQREISFLRWLIVATLVAYAALSLVLPIWYPRESVALNRHKPFSGYVISSGQDWTTVLHAADGSSTIVRTSDVTFRTPCRQSASLPQESTLQLIPGVDTRNPEPMCP